MAIIQCPECDGKVSDKAICCPHCGYPMKDVKQTPTVKQHKHQKSVPTKYPKLPHGFGSIQYQKTGNRINPFAARTPYTMEDRVNSQTPYALGYYSKWNDALDCLIQYHMEKKDFDVYLPGMIELLMRCSAAQPSNPEFSLALRTLMQYEKNPSSIPITSSIDEIASAIVNRINPVTHQSFTEIYEEFLDDKFNDPLAKYSTTTKDSYISGYKNARVLHNVDFSSIRTDDLQQVLDSCTLGYSSRQNLVKLFHGMYKYAMKKEKINTDYSKFITIKQENDTENGEPFFADELKILWEHADDPTVAMILFMIYSGHRISEYTVITKDPEKGYLIGGLKNQYSRNRVVPIHPLIKDFADSFDPQSFKTSRFRQEFSKKLSELGLSYSVSGKKHTPHDTRHTFSWLCDVFKVDPVSKKRLMGHTLGSDVESRVYTHRTIEQLTYELNKIKKEIPDELEKVRYIPTKTE